MQLGLVRQFPSRLRLRMRSAVALLGDIKVPFRPKLRLKNIIEPWALPITIVILICGVALGHSEFGKAIERNSFEKIFFVLRSYFSPPTLDPRIKIFSYDDRTVQEMGDFDIPLKTWNTVLTTLKKKQPARIYIDKLFDRRFSKDELATLLTNDDTTKSVPVSIITFASDLPIPHRNELQSSSLTSNRLAMNCESRSARQYLYGAQAELWQASNFTPGHAVYNGDGRFRLLVRSGDSLTIPHIGMTGADRIDCSASNIHINGIRAGSASSENNYEVPVNFGSRHFFKKSSYSMAPLIHAAQENRDIPVVNPGDHVIILPAMYTGNTDWRETPFGSMAGGLVVASVVNSQLTGEWLTLVNGSTTLILTFGAIVFLFGLYGNQKILLLGTIGGIFGYLLVSFGLFVGVGLIFPVAVPLSSALFCMGTIMYARESIAQQTKMRIDAELEAASKVQNAFLPHKKIEKSNFRLNSIFVPTSECGGDWWTYHQAAEHRHCIVIGDAVGHGLSAALVTAVSYAVTGTILTTTREEMQPKDLMQRLFESLNQMLLGMNSNNALMTFQCIYLDASTSKALVVSSGHPFPLVFPASLQDSRLKGGKNAIPRLVRGGMLGEGIPAPIGFSEFDLVKGDRIVMYTDGIIENTDRKKQKPYSRYLLEKSVVNVQERDFDTFFQTITGNYLEYVDGTTPADDATLVVFEVP